jgi:hypothetical protein
VPTPYHQRKRPPDSIRSRAGEWLTSVLDEAGAVIDEVYDELDGYKRRQMGDGWKPQPRHFHRN